jgi:flagellar basal body-associated protein FliL
MAKNSKDEEGGVKVKKKSKHIGLIAFLVIILVLGYIAFTYGSLPYAFLTAKNHSFGALTSIMLAKLNSAKAVNVSYNGSVTVNKSDPEVLFNYYKNGNTTFIYLEISHRNGNADEVSANLTNLTQPGMVCRTYYRGNSSIGPFCTRERPYLQFLNLTDEIVNLQTLNNVSIKNLGLQLYHGQPCYSINGTANVMINGTLFGASGYVPSSVNFHGCVSAQYNVPLYFAGSANTTNGTTVIFDFVGSRFNFGGNVFT